MHKCTDTQAVCRGCGKLLDGSPYFKGGRAYDPKTREAAKVCHYGGWVCSRECDYRATLTLEQSMPGHRGQARLSGDVLRKLNARWEGTQQ